MTIRKGAVIDFRTILLLDLLYMLFFLLSGKPEVVVAAFLLSGTVLFLTELYVAMIRYAVLFVALFFYYHAITNLRLPFLQGTLFSLLGVAAFIIQRILPFLMLAVVIRDRKNISEITASLERCRLPKGIILSMTVMLRYFPSMKEELRIIIEAMKLKGIDTSWRGVLLHPIRMLEYVIVPMLFRSLRTAEEFSCAALVKGIEHPGRRSSYFDVRLRPLDGLLSSAAVLSLLVSMQISIF